VLSRDDLLEVLANQLVVMSKVAWRKHVCLQAAVVLGVLATGAFVIAGVGA
jgi:hypothetical protein